MARPLVFRLICERGCWYGLLFALLFACSAFVHQRSFNSATPASRLAMLQAIVCDCSLNIDAHSSTPDAAAYQGRRYSDKAPGTAGVALPAFAIAAGFLRLFRVPLQSECGQLASSWAGCVGSIGIMTALGGVTLFAWLRGWVAPRSALVTTLALFLGAAPLPYATMMFSHALVVGLLAIAIWAAVQESGVGSRESGVGRRGTEEGTRKTAQGEGREAGPMRRWLREYRWELLGGFACGWALASEYSSGLVVISIVLWLVVFPVATNGAVGGAPSPDPSGARAEPSVPTMSEACGEAGRRGTWYRRMVSGLNRGRVVAFCVATVPPLLLIPAYSWACFGNPFTLPYSHQASFPAMREGLYAIKWPDPVTAFNLLFSPTRGLFFWTPFLLMAGFGYRSLFERAPRMFWLTYLVPLLQVVVISGRTWDWQAGPTLGPRLLAPMLPLLALPCALGVARWPRLGGLLAVYSIGITTLATLTDACPSGEIYNPLLDLHIPLLLKGEFSPNIGILLGLPPYGSVALYYGILIGGVVWLWRRLPNGSEEPAASPSAGNETCGNT